jgi:hypothetical protein
MAALELAVEPRPVSLHLTLNWGTSTEVVHANEPLGHDIGPGVWKYVQQAYLGYRVPVLDGLLIEAGIFPSHTGFERLPTRDDWTYTRAWMSDYGVYYQSGVRARLTLNDRWMFGLYLVNGWQIIGENNEWKTAGTQIVFRPCGCLELRWNTLAGPEPPAQTHALLSGLRDTGSDWRLFSDLIMVWTPRPRWSVAATWDAGIQQRPGFEAALFHGGALYGRYAVLPGRLFAALRGEYYYDGTGAITGTAQTLYGVTGTVDLRAVEHLVVKLEARYDHSDADVFEAHKLIPGTLLPEHKQDQALFVLGAVASF